MGNTRIPLRFFAFFVGLTGLAHVWVGWQLLPPLAYSLPSLIAGMVILAVSWLSMPGFFLSRHLHSRLLAHTLYGLGSICMGLFSVLLPWVLLREIVLAILAPWVNERLFSLYAYWTALGSLVLMLGLFILGFVNAWRMPRITFVDILLSSLPESWKELRIAQISDLHIGPLIRERRIAHIVAQTNRLKPDLIALTGDMVDGSVTELATATASLSALRAPLGVFYVTGNHEYFSNAEQWLEVFRRQGFRVLQNTHESRVWLDSTLVIAGVNDPLAERFQDPSGGPDPHFALQGAPADATLRILLAHRPETAFSAVDAGFDIQLSGHTHGGQFWPWTWVVGRAEPFATGFHQLGKLWVITSRGTGFWGPPLRLGSPAEIVLVRIRRP